MAVATGVYSYRENNTVYIFKYMVFESTTVYTGDLGTYTKVDI